MEKLSWKRNKQTLAFYDEIVSFHSIDSTAKCWTRRRKKTTKKKEQVVICCFSHRSKYAIVCKRIPIPGKTCSQHLRRHSPCHVSVSLTFCVSILWQSHRVRTIANEKENKIKTPFCRFFVCDVALCRQRCQQMMMTMTAIQLNIKTTCRRHANHCMAVFLIRFEAEPKKQNETYKLHANQTENENNNKMTRNVRKKHENKIIRFVASDWGCANNFRRAQLHNDLTTWNMCKESE